MSEKETEVVYCIKYALTSGIFLITGYETDPGNFYCPKEWQKYYHKGEWARLPEEALKICEKKREAKLKSLRKQLEHMSTLTFKLP